MSLSIAIVQDTRREKKSKKYPVKLRVIFDRTPEYYPTIYDLSEEDYKKLEAPRIGTTLQEIRKKLEQLETDAKKVANSLDTFSFEKFEKEFVQSNAILKQKKKRSQPYVISTYEFDTALYEKRFPILTEIHPDKDYISATFTDYIKQLLEEGRIGTALSYQAAYFSLKKFRGNIRFTDVTKLYLTQYEQWMVQVKKRSKATVGINLRPLRTMFNTAIENGIIKRDMYPFGRKKYRIPTARNIKKALQMDSIQKIFEHDPEQETVKRGKAYWLFCYLGNGMNPKDFAYLQYKNIEGEYLHFIRAKTERSTKDDPKIITIYLNEIMLQIIEQWGNKDKSPDNYIFPIIRHGDDLLQQYKRVTVLSKFICDSMDVLSKEVGLATKPTNMVCRHSFSTIMKRSGASTEFIQEALGHTDKKTTENYLDSFENEIKKEFSAKLTPFVKTPHTDELISDEMFK